MAGIPSDQKANATDTTKERHMDEHGIEEAFQAKLAEERARLGSKRPNVLVCGYTGTGKTALIQAICGDLVPDGAIGDGSPATMGFDEYANEHIRVWDSKGMELGDGEQEFTSAMRRFVRERQSDSCVDNHVHIVWYTIQAPGARITACDLDLVRDVFHSGNVIVVLTKADIARPEQIEAMIKRLAEAGVDPHRVVATSDRRGGAQGCRELMTLTHSMLPTAYRDSFMEAQRVDRHACIQVVGERKRKATAIIGASVALATGVGATPIPVADAALLIPIQTAMIASLAALYGVGKGAIRHAVLPFLARIVGVYTSSSLLKLLPGLGSVVNAAVAGTITGALGRYTQMQFEAMAIARINGTPIPVLSFDLRTFKQFFQDRAA
jgi:uncharacterized protein (DUF697 family)/predicted GTPase